MRFFECFILLTVLAFLPLSAHGAPVSEADRLLKENILLKSEHQLSKTPQIYLIFDLPGKKILIKARGVVLKTLPVASFTMWGAVIQPQPHSLLKKDAIFKPRRVEIRPKKKPEESAPEAAAPQLEDMPSRFRLDLDRGITLFVRPASAGVLSGFWNLLSSLKSYLITRPFGTLRTGLRHGSYTEIVLHLDARDARSLYWSFLEGYRCLILSD
jgi:hypothetical protein